MFTCYPLSLSLSDIFTCYHSNGVVFGPDHPGESDGEVEHERRAGRRPVHDEAHLGAEREHLARARVRQELALLRAEEPVLRLLPLQEDQLPVHSLQPDQAGKPT